MTYPIFRHFPKGARVAAAVAIYIQSANVAIWDGHNDAPGALRTADGLCPLGVALRSMGLDTPNTPLPHHLADLLCPITVDDETYPAAWGRIATQAERFITAWDRQTWEPNATNIVGNIESAFGVTA